MDFVQSFDLNKGGLTAMQIPCLKVSLPPTEQTRGAVGLFAMVEGTGAVYKCVAADDVNGVYAWKGMDEEGLEETDAKYFDIDVDGLVSLKAEYRGESSADSAASAAYLYAVSDNGVGVAGTKNSELPPVLVIPQNIDGEEVTGFQKGAFCGNKQVREIIIPDTVKEIPAGFVREAIHLEKVTNTEQIESIGNGAFLLTRIKEALFPNLKTLGKNCFRNASCLVRADVGNVTEIPSTTFYWCENLSEVRGPKVASIGKVAFWGTRRLKNLPFLANVTSVGDNAFWSSRCELEDLPDNCTFDTVFKSSYLQWNDTDYWTGVAFEPCRNPLGSLFHQKNPAWADKEVKYTDKNGKLWVYKKIESDEPCTFGSGCAFFTLLEIYSAFMGVDFNSPEEFFPILEEAGVLGIDYRYRDGWCQIANGLGFETEYYSTMTSEVLRKMYDALKDGALLYKSTMDNDNEHGGHAMLGYGINSDGEMLTADSSMHCWEVGIYENHKTAWHIYKHGSAECDCVIVRKPQKSGAEVS